MKNNSIKSNYTIDEIHWYTLPKSVVIGAEVAFLVYPFIIVKRIKGEEEFLEKELDGYCEYKNKVKYRLIPFIW